ncbi:MAG: cobalt-precorrin-6A reductase [Pseudomonadota bacterium]
MAERILILGGTKEAAELAMKLVAEHGDEAVTTSLAGRTKEPKPVAGQVRIGGFGGAEGLAKYLTQNGITKLIDATHPFAKTISANAKRAADMTGVPIETRERPPWERQVGDQWIEVTSLGDAIQFIPDGARVLLAIGAQHIGEFSGMADATLLARTVDPPRPGRHSFIDHWIIGRPSENWRDEAELFVKHQITHIVCRNSGGTGAYAKIEAARELGLPVIIVRR